MRITLDELLARYGSPRTAVLPSFIRYEACARCGCHHRLIRIGKLWLQPPHDCRLVEEV